MKYRYFLELSYKGKNYSGWQIQPHHQTVQQTLQDAFKMLVKSDVEIVGAGRTDTGVHASYYVAHLDIDVLFENTDQLIYKVNCILPKDIVLFSLILVSMEFHARFSAIRRCYKYQICLKKNAFYHDYAWYLYKKLDLDMMQKAADILLQTDDFTSFCKISKDQPGHLCKVDKADWHKSGDLLIFTIEANRFLRNMVRAIVGTLVKVGEQAMSIEDFKLIIEKKNRSEAGISVPSQGLFLSNIHYPEHINKLLPYRNNLADIPTIHVSNMF